MYFWMNDELMPYRMPKERREREEEKGEKRQLSKWTTGENTLRVSFMLPHNWILEYYLQRHKQTLFISEVLIKFVSSGDRLKK